MASSAHHYDVPWCTVGPVVVMYHANLSVNISVQYDQRTVFGSHAAYAVWTGTDPRSYSLSTNMVASNTPEVVFNMGQVVSAYKWTQQSPPICLPLVAPMTMKDGLVMVRIEGYDSSVDEGVHLDSGIPIQVSLSLSLKECKPI